MADKDIVTVKKGNSKPIKVTEKVYRVVLQEQGYKKEANRGKTRSKQKEENE